jgi:hypothetical protein
MGDGATGVQVTPPDASAAVQVGDAGSTVLVADSVPDLWHTGSAQPAAIPDSMMKAYLGGGEPPEVRQLVYQIPVTSVTPNRDGLIFAGRRIPADVGSETVDPDRQKLIHDWINFWGSFTNSLQATTYLTHLSKRTIFVSWKTNPRHSWKPSAILRTLTLR